MADLGPNIDMSTWTSTTISNDDLIQVVDSVTGNPKFTKMTVGSLVSYMNSNVTASYVSYSTGSGNVILSASGSGAANAVLYINISGSSYYVNLYNNKA